jgi:hypothetical protein
MNGENHRAIPEAPASRVRPDFQDRQAKSATILAGSSIASSSK